LIIKHWTPNELGTELPPEDGQTDSTRRINVKQNLVCPTSKKSSWLRRQQQLPFTSSKVQAKSFEVISNLLGRALHPLLTPRSGKVTLQPQLRGLAASARWLLVCPMVHYQQKYVPI